MRQYKPRTWESIYYASIRRGDDPAYALFLADQWKERKERQAKRTQDVRADDYTKVKEDDHASR